MFKFVLHSAPDWCSICTKKETVRDHLLANALFLFGPDVDGRVVGIVVLGIQIILHNAQRVSKPLEMHDFSFSQEFERLANIRVVDQAEKVVVGCSGLLLSYYVIRTTIDWNLYKSFHAAVWQEQQNYRKMTKIKQD